eukprot:GGOE01036904.1.p1 GENE.GGOE01036904.1~~GGOE01036904.1.p1  ORF type:complete len:563 (+),score=149.79 GGOE01036904.1:38-1726(+)
MPSGALKTPLNQRRHDNISIVSMERGGKHFEVACYRNKVTDWKTGAEKDLSNVIQVERVFVNVKKGEFAAKADLQRIFPGKEEMEIIQEILNKGASQVNTMEREFHRDKLFKQIAHTAAEMSVDPWYHRLYTGRIIEKAMEQFGYSLKPAVPVKAQAVEVIRFLKAEGMPIERASMKFVVDFPNAEARNLLGRWVRNHSRRLLPRVLTAWCLRRLIDPAVADKVADWVPPDTGTYERCWVLHESNDASRDSAVFSIGFVFPPHLYNRVEQLVRDAGGSISLMDLRWAEREDICISELVVPKQRVTFKESSSEEDMEVELRQRRKEREEQRQLAKRREKLERRKGKGDDDEERMMADAGKKGNRPRKGKASEALDEEEIERLQQEAKAKADAEEKANKKSRRKATRAPGQPKLVVEPKKREKKKNEDDVSTPSDEEIKDLVLGKSERRKLRAGKKREESSDSEVFHSDRDSDYEEYLNFYETTNDYRHTAKAEATSGSADTDGSCAVAGGGLREPETIAGGNGVGEPSGPEEEPVPPPPGECTALQDSDPPAHRISTEPASAP